MILPSLLPLLMLSACGRGAPDDRATGIEAQDNAAAAVEIERMKAEIAVLEAQARASALSNELAARDAAEAMAVEEPATVVPDPEVAAPAGPEAPPPRTTTSSDDLDAAAARVRADMERRRAER